MIEELSSRIAAIEGVDARFKAIFEWHGVWFASGVFSGCLFERAVADYGTSDSEFSEISALLNLLEDVLPEEFSTSEARSLAGVILMLIDGVTSPVRAFRDPRVAKHA